MKFSSQEEYGLRCLLQIARRSLPVTADGQSEEAGTSMTIPEISRVEGLSATHVAKILMILRKEGFITSTRGQTGGYTLARPASQITVGEVLNALGGRLFDAEFCRRHSGSLDVCTHDVECSIRSVWQIVQDAVDTVLLKLTLADMLSKRDEPKSNVQFFATPQRAIAVSDPEPPTY